MESTIMGFLNRISRKKTKEKKIENRSSRVPKKQRPSTKMGLYEVQELVLAEPSNTKEYELKRKEAYSERPIQKLLRNLLEDEKVEIVPTYDHSQGFRYSTVERILNKNDPEEAQDLLDRLSNLKILEKTFYDTVSSCPSCSSTSITLHHRCPKCSSHHIAKTSLTEHIPCGNIDDRDKYIHEICPKCKKILNDGEYRDMGRWYICRECKEKFENPELDIVCRNCYIKFTFQKAMIRKISKYRLNRSLEPEIRQNVTSLEGISEILIDLGFKIETPAMMIGEKSGIEHSFSLLAKKNLGGSIITVDHAVGEPEVSASQLILYAYKLSETQVDVPIFVAIPKLSTPARRIAEGYNILVIEGIPQEKQINLIKDEIQRRLSNETVLPEAGLPEVEELIKELIVRRGKKVDVWRDSDSGKFVKRPL
jgi:predicted RNA-binding Zn-ribbon protein involved in translation (DUF1610 family)